MQLDPVPLKALSVPSRLMFSKNKSLHIKANYISLWIVLVCIAVASGVEQILDPQDIVETCIWSAILAQSREREGQPIRNLRIGLAKISKRFERVYRRTQSVIRQLEF